MGTGCSRGRGKAGHAPRTHGAPTSPCHPAPPKVFFQSETHESPRRRNSRHHAFPEDATAGRTAPRMSHPPESQEGAASWLRLSIFLRGARALAWPDGSRLRAGLCWRVLLGHIGRAGVAPAEKSAPAAPAGRARRSGPDLQTSKAHPLGSPPTPSPLKAAGQLPGPRPYRPPSPRRPGWLRAAGRPFPRQAHTRDRDKRLQLETRLIDTISSIIASRIR